MSRGLRRTVGAALATAALTVGLGACGSGDKAPAPPAEVVLNRGQETSIPFRTGAEGEVLLGVTTAAPGVSWGSPGSESAVVSLFVDNTYATDVVIPTSFPIKRSLALGHLAAGDHTLRAQFAADRSPQGAASARLTGFAFQTVTPQDNSYQALAHAPVVYGRTTPLPAAGSPAAGAPSAATAADPLAGGPFQNAITDTPLLAFHSETPTAISGHRLLTYSVVWSNEDGGTSTPALMAQWGRTTDIEWTYQVEIDAAGNAIPGSAVIQGPDHATQPFTGRSEGGHPLLGTCTLNNGLCQNPDGPMRFALSAADTLDPNADARERQMDRNPWTYWVMAQEVAREGKVDENKAPNSTTKISDPHNYVYLIIRKSTVGAPNTEDNWVGLSVGVRLSGNGETYRSNKIYPLWAIARDTPAATAVELPPGTVAEDISTIEATRVVGAGVDRGARITVDSIERAFLLGPDGVPQQSFLFTPAKATLSQAAPTATLFRRPQGGS
ncbi:hypothetical protein ND748_12885 [Frankia sp. AiPs1]|uniref:hypothetical protein n=1 Tax=Frankia sp. AiPs1 TaxID=573493 RepID=UPI002043A36F|nr:hypothetical protein [Frankia sp. AiPs1]MCM3922550.1 hypothetical protein [Frankia sp. AiPs1]